MHRQDVRTKEAEEERMEENNLLHFLDSPNAHYRRCLILSVYLSGNVKNTYPRMMVKPIAMHQTDVGMVEFVGLIKVDIRRGTNLAVRDVMSSDPYVMLNLGHQTMKTKVIKNTLNPVWNERLMLSIPHPVPPLKLQVFDKDTFSSDDRMGDVEVDIQPLIAAAREHESSAIAGSVEVTKLLASDDGTLARDSVISVVDGKVKQDIALRLQNVEHGELEIELECVPLSQ
uniref:C2 domain-containing protein n=1 Tax=Oryza meridionalis TaxID=40149 RepID=A0A0E0DQX3_9ORYZ